MANNCKGANKQALNDAFAQWKRSRCALDNIERHKEATELQVLVAKEQVAKYQHELEDLDKSFASIADEEAEAYSHYCFIEDLYDRFTKRNS